MRSLSEEEHLHLTILLSHTTQ